MIYVKEFLTHNNELIQRKSSKKFDEPLQLPEMTFKLTMYEIEDILNGTIYEDNYLNIILFVQNLIIKKKENETN